MNTGLKTLCLAAGLACGFPSVPTAHPHADAQTPQTTQTQPGSAPQAQVPALHGTVLTGATVDLPASLEGKRGVLVLGFSTASRDEVAAWGRRLAGDYRDSSAVAYYEMPVIAAVPRLLRGWVAKKVTEGVPDRARSRCVLVLDHEAEWKAAAGFTRDEDAYVLLVDASGTVLWRAAGSADDARYADLKHHLEP